MIRLTPKEIANQIIIQHPEWSNQQVATHMGCSLRSVYRYIGSQQDRTGRQIGHLEETAQKVLKDDSETKILIFDIETSPLICATWGIYKQLINPGQVLRDTAILTIAWKWLYSPRVYSAHVTEAEAKAGDDLSVVKRFWKVLDDADVVIGFNSKKFDHKRLNARLLINGMDEPSPYVALDIFAEMKRKFSFSSNKLDYVNKLLGMSGKITTNMDLWLEAIKGEITALREMQRYNKEDVQITEALYDALKGWIKHPNLGLYVTTDEEVCPTCESKNLEPNGFYNTPLGRFESLRCTDCRSLSRRRVNVLDAGNRKRQLVSI